MEKLEIHSNRSYIQGSSSLSVYSGVNIPQKIFLTVFISNYYLIILRRSWKRDEEGVSGIISGIIEDDFQNLSIQVCFVYNSLYGVVY